MKPLLALVVFALLGGVAGGLWRVGVPWPASADLAWPRDAAAFHAALMLGAFLGSVIGIERAVALKRRAAFAAPVASALGGLCLLLGQPVVGAWLGVAAASAFVIVSVAIVRRQAAAHTVLLLVGAAAWLAGNLVFAIGPEHAAPLPLWFAFIITTVAAERLEMTRLMRRGPYAAPLLAAVLALMLIGAAASVAFPAPGGVLFGTALTWLAAWFGRFDVARRTVRTHGLARYMAVALLGGYAWLALAGVAWVGMALGWPLRDAALHALGLGFIVSMMMGHAPVILPAVARIKLQFGNVFYLPLAALHLSLLLRLAGGRDTLPLRALGASFNAIAIALFAATVAGAALAWRHRHGASPAWETRS